MLENNNKWGGLMKKSYLAFLVTALVLISVVIWLGNSELSIDYMELSQLIVILLLIGFGVFFGVKRLKSEKKGEPVEDELSKKIMRKAAAISYFISIYLWLGIMYISDKKWFETEELFGLGIIGMALVLAVTWVLVYFIGLKNE